MNTSIFKLIKLLVEFISILLEFVDLLKII